MVAVWAVLLLAALPLLPRVAGALEVGGFSSAGTEAARAAQVLRQELGYPPSSMLVIYQSDTLQASDPAFQQAVTASLVNVPALPFVTQVQEPLASAGMVSADGHTAYALIGLNLPNEAAQRLVPELEAALVPQPEVTMLLAGGPASYRDIETVSQRDLQRAELLVFPIALVALLVIFGSAVSAAMPLVIGGAGVVMVLVSLLLATRLTDLSIFALNLATMLGFGLAIDYSLFVTARYREELAHGQPVGEAVARTTATAGKAVFFSGTTVLIGLLGLSQFEFMFLRSVGVAGVIVVAWSTIAALTLLPALLAIIGRNIDRYPIRRTRNESRATHGFWVTLSGAVMKRPVAVLIPTLALLLLLGSPFRHAQISSPDATILPKGLPSREAFDALTAAFGPGEVSPFVVVIDAPGRIFSDETLGEVYALSRRIAQNPEVVRVQSVTPPNLPEPLAIATAKLQRGLAATGSAQGAKLANENAAVLLVYGRDLAGSDASKALLADIRGLSIASGDIQVGGGTAEIVDSVAAMYADFPRAAALIVAATYLVLLLLFRSVLLPVKAILMNTLSILASYGALVWVFQDGHLDSLLGFTALGYVEASLPIILFCVLFGLSMDYEVFLLSRIREEWERTGNNTEAVAVGLQRSGRIITSAALLVVIVTASFVTADVVLIKALGFGIALAVTLDATVVRALLVPATMKLLGAWNWWLPAPLARVLPRASFIEETT
ncbi:MAG: MMPL family transporter [Thermomicrobiales bacterium]